MNANQKFPTRKSSGIHVAEFAKIRAADFPKSCDFGYGNSLNLLNTTLYYNTLKEKIKKSNGCHISSLQPHFYIQGKRLISKGLRLVY